MKYLSTRSNHQPVGAAEAILLGMAPGGGLFVPESFPAFAPRPELSYQELAREILALYLDDYSAAELEQIVSQSYRADNFPAGVAPVRKVGERFMLELWHGPTLAFKDMALQIMPRLLTAAARKCGLRRELLILVATSGDTGKAALEGFKDVPGTRVLVFYPKDGVSAIQERQMLTTGGGNTGVFAVKGNFDDCQRAVKELFADEELKQSLYKAGLQFSSANSINWGRLVPQIVYYFHAYGQLLRNQWIEPEEKINVVVPTGNFGNILAACYAARMGLPVNKLLCASNSNNVLTDAINELTYDRRRPFYRTDSPSMDILVSSNFERLIFELYDRDGGRTAAAFSGLEKDGWFKIPPAVLGLFSGGCAGDARAARALAETFRTHAYLLDPHTAVAAAVEEDYRERTGDAHRALIVSTASPFKFPGAVLSALGEDVSALREEDQLARMSALSGLPVPPQLTGLGKEALSPLKVLEKGQLRQAVLELLG
ncbi:MAG: threonine synthase [Clostridiales bacterium]|nr:threonine synthase [Clostridiales bacterium]